MKNFYMIIAQNYLITSCNYSNQINVHCVVFSTMRTTTKGEVGLQGIHGMCVCLSLSEQMKYEEKLF